MVSIADFLTRTPKEHYISRWRALTSIICNNQKYDLYVSYKKYLSIIFDKNHNKLEHNLLNLSLLLNVDRIETNMWYRRINLIWSKFTKHY